MLLGIVLAGGQSRRMGEDKALLNWEGKTLLEHATQLLQEVGCDEVFVSRNAPHCIKDIYPGKGPVAGIHACLAASESFEALVIPVDMPLLTRASLSNLVIQGRVFASSCYYNASVMPCYLRVNPTVLAECELRLQQNRLSLHALLDAIAAKAIRFDEVAETQELMNTNTPAQWLLANRVVNDKELA